MIWRRQRTAPSVMDMSSLIGEGNIHREFTLGLYSFRMFRCGGGRLTVQMEDLVLDGEIRSPSSFVR